MAVRRRSGLVLGAVRPLADQVAEAQGLVVWDLEFRREAGRETLRVAVDRAGASGVDAEGIASFAEALSRKLDLVDAVPGDGRYLLEVTSPGAERKLRRPEEFTLVVGRPVRLTFKDGREPVTGRIADAGTSDLVVETGEPEPLRVPYELISQARLTVPGA